MATAYYADQLPFHCGTGTRAPILCPPLKPVMVMPIQICSVDDHAGLAEPGCKSLGCQIEAT